MEEKSYVELLIEYAKKRGYDPKTHMIQNMLVVSPSDRMHSRKLVYFDVKDHLFIAVDSFGSKMGNSTTFCGIYTKTELSKNKNCNIRVKDFVISLFTVNKVKTGNSYIDKKIIISTENRRNNPISIKERDVDTFIDIHKIVKPVKISVIDGNFDEIPKLKGKSTIGVELNRWIVTDKELDPFIEKGCKLLTSLKNQN